MRMKAPNFWIFSCMEPAIRMESSKIHRVKRNSMMKYVAVLPLLGLVLWNAIVVADATATASASNNVHASVRNTLGEGKTIKVHCQSKDNDLGEHTVGDGSEFGWDFSPNTWGTTLFYCEIALKGSKPPLPDSYHFDAYSFGRDFVRCQAQCSWLVSNQGIYALNSQTSFWEFMYPWSNSSK